MCYRKIRVGDKAEMQAGGRMTSKQNASSAIKRAYAKVRVTQWAPEMGKKMMKGKVNTF